ncbi:MurR/RpiR family transcriptional regulator [Kaistia dalseonensis]|uniref:DNA-binding MurR/RpiR family transcriptional regulator n=1 Tax=Kaistia dalseonensis TaxID=410840 RepID=A0ABU0H728_9HYPH|nr:MurR/RpiR family transcriptional regulator [Kaistia dalseonensis]MCX5495520.1 MurR/RpiR family transcriptional regulator [Kaistia dalseonensis]MDQ0438112.1 DNA-binding MurR/RpiR family transcriptional regulator [Kaistia dalseonensis]
MSREFGKPAVPMLPASAIVAERIAAAYPELSQALRTFADFVLAEPLRIARMSINDTVAASGVSVATANRFARTIGFDGYAQFRQELIRGFESVLSPDDRLKRKLSEESTAREVLVASLEEDIENLKATILNLDDERCAQAVTMIAQARKIFIIGFDRAGSLAELLANGLELAGCNVRMVENAGGAAGAARQLYRFGDEDLVISIAFPRYLKDTVELTHYVRQRGLRVLAITDNQNSPLAAFGDLTLYVRAARQYSSTSDTAILGLIEALIAGVTHQCRAVAGELADAYLDFSYPWLSTPRGGGNGG